MGTTTLNGIKVPVILCHQDSYRLGLGSNHADVLHWFPKFGKNMDDFRKDVAALIEEERKQEEEEEELTIEKVKQFVQENPEAMVELFGQLMQEYRKTLQDNDCSAWSKEGREFCIKNNIITGGGLDAEGNPNYMYQDFMTREQLMVVIQRVCALIAKGLAANGVR